MVYLKSVITLGKLIGLLFLFCLPPPLNYVFETKRNDLACPVMGTIFLVSRHVISNLRDWSKCEGYGRITHTF